LTRCAITSIGELAASKNLEESMTQKTLSLGSGDRAGTQTAAAAGALALTLAVAAGCWVLSVGQMNGMNMGVATRLGSFAFFVAVWVPMMAAMMLPGAVPAVVRRARLSNGLRTVPTFVIAYVGVWAAVGVAVYALYRPHGPVAAGVLVIAAGLYELTPLKQACRRRCGANGRSGMRFGLCCVGSSIGLMLALLALGLMSVIWMAVITGITVAQKLLPPRAAIDAPLALAIVGFGALVIVAPSSIPGLMPSM
jgi:predicted metal-binding membrane protein